MARNLTEQEKQTIAEKIKAGQTWQSIIQQFNCSTATIYRIVKDTGVEFKKKREKCTSSHVTFSHIKHGDNFIYDAF
jgi:Mor family transcriptional regulator